MITHAWTSTLTAFVSSVGRVVRNEFRLIEGQFTVSSEGSAIQIGVKEMIERFPMVISEKRTMEDGRSLLPIELGAVQFLKCVRRSGNRLVQRARERERGYLPIVLRYLSARQTITFSIHELMLASRPSLSLSLSLMYTRELSLVELIEEKRKYQRWQRPRRAGGVQTRAYVTGIGLMPDHQRAWRARSALNHLVTNAGKSSASISMRDHFLQSICPVGIRAMRTTWTSICRTERSLRKRSMTNSISVLFDDWRLICHKRLISRCVSRIASHHRARRRRTSSNRRS